MTRIGYNIDFLLRQWTNKIILFKVFVKWKLVSGFEKSNMAGTFSENFK